MEVQRFYPLQLLLLANKLPWAALSLLEPLVFKARGGGEPRDRVLGSELVVGVFLILGVLGDANLAYHHPAVYEVLRHLVKDVGGRVLVFEEHKGEAFPLPGGLVLVDEDVLDLAKLFEVGLDGDLVGVVVEAGDEHLPSHLGVLLFDLLLLGLYGLDSELKGKGG